MTDKTTDIKAKELSKSPFIMVNKLDKELKTFKSLIDRLTTSTIVSELNDKLQLAFEQSLKKTVDPIMAHIKGNALEILGYCDAANMFKVKAKELGYVVENKIIKENITLTENELGDPLNYFADFWNKKENQHKTLYFIKKDVDSEMGSDKWLVGMQDYNDFKIESWDIAYSNKDLNDAIEVLNDMLEANPSGIHLITDDEENYVVENKINESKNLTPQQHELLNKYSNYLVNNNIDLKKIGYAQAIRGYENTFLATTFTTEAITSPDLYNVLITKYTALSEILKSNLQNVTNDWDNGNINDDNKTIVINAISAIVGDTKENIEALINETSINEENDGIKTNESVKQEMGYSPNEDRNWSFFRNSDVKIEKPEFDSMSLKNLISDDAFLKFSYHNLATGDEDKDLEMIYKNYIKGDETLMNKLKEYDRLTTKIQENAITKDAVATSIINTLKQFDINVGTTDSTQDINTNIIAKITDLLKVQMPGAKEAYLLDILHSKDVKEELINTFKIMSVKDIVDKIKHSNIMITDVQGHDHSESNLIEKIKTSFNISEGSADFVAFTFTMSLHIALSIAYIGIVPASTVMAICVGILILSAVGLSYE